MSQKRVLDKRKYVFVFIITAAIFLCGLLIGSLTSSQKLVDVRELQDSLQSDTLDLEILYSILEQDPCMYVNTTPLSDKLYDVAVKLDYMESLLGKGDDTVLRLKKYYSLLEIRQWLFESRVKEECNYDKHIILYFYSNEDGACPQCEEQGFILSYLRKKYGETLGVYSFEYGLPSESLQTLVRRYDITALPAIVIDDETHIGFYSTAELEDLLFVDVDPLRELILPAKE